MCIRDRPSIYYISDGFDINDNGQVVGDAHPEGKGEGIYPRHAFLYTDSVGMKDLGTLGGDVYSAATGINNAGEVTGVSYSEASRGFLYLDENGMINLDDLVIGTPEDLAAWAEGQIEAKRINAFGDICGSSDVHGPFLLRRVDP